jgi:hypothetical protein
MNRPRDADARGGAGERSANSSDYPQDTAAAGAVKRGPLRRARAEALAHELAYRGGADYLGSLCAALCDRWKSNRWTKADLDRAVEDLVAAGRLDLEVGARGIRLRLVEPAPTEAEDPS